MGLQTFDAHTPLMSIVQLSSSDGTTRSDVINANVYPTLVESILLTCDDPAVHVVQLFVVGPGFTVPLGSVSVPVNQGTLGTPALDLFASAFPALPTSVVLPIGFKFQVALSVALTTGHLSVVSLYAQF